VIEDVIPRNIHLHKIKVLITPSKKPCLYSLIIGEHGTGKTTLIQHAVEDLKEPKGVVYVDIDEQSTSFAEAMQQALEWYPDPVINSTTKGNLSSSLCVSVV
jgi:Ni2+-binding GTPase involved in maturation of urease and hydrogenase